MKLLLSGSLLLLAFRLRRGPKKTTTKAAAAQAPQRVWAFLKKELCTPPVEVVAAGLLIIPFAGYIADRRRHGALVVGAVGA